MANTQPYRLAFFSTADDGCPAFAADVEFDDAEAGTEVSWGVRLDGPPGA